MATATTSTNSSKTCSSSSQALAPLFSTIEVPHEIVLERMLPLLNAQSIGVCTGLSKTWNVIITGKDELWRVLFDRDYQFFKLNPTTTYQELYKRLHFNLTKGVCASDVVQQFPSVVKVSVISDETAYLGCDDGTIKVLDVKTGICTSTFQGRHRGPVQCLAVSDDQLFSTSEDKLKIWDRKTGTCTKSIRVRPLVCSLAYNDGKLYLGLGNGTIKIFDLLTKRTIGTLQAANDTFGVGYLDIADGELFSDDGSGSINVWDLATLKKATHFGHYDPITAFARAPGKFFTGNVEKIKLWDLKKTRCTFLKGHMKRVTDLVFAHDKLVSSSVDNTMKIWDIETEKCIASYGYMDHLPHDPMVENAILSLAADNKGRIIASFKDKTIKIFDLTADHGIIFERIAELFEKGAERWKGYYTCEAMKAAMHLFSNMPIVEREKIYPKFIEIIKLPVEPENSAASYFHDEEFGAETLQDRVQTAKNRGQAIRARLGELPTKQNPSLAHLGFHTRKDFYDKLKCNPEFLQKVGISSLEDLKCICSLSGLKKLSTIEVKETQADRGTKINAKNRMCELTKAPQELLKIVDKIKEKTAVGTWTAFQQKLNAFQAKLHEIDQQCDGDPTKILHAFSGENYNGLVGEFNAFIEEFEVAKLHAYVNQKGLVDVWRDQMNAGVRSIAKLPPSEQMGEKLLRMGE